MSPTLRAQAAVAELMAQAGVKETDLTEQFIRAQGPGGQKVNKTASAVVLTHVPTGTAVKCQTSRSQAHNRLLARRRLCQRLLLAKAQGQQAEADRIARLRRQKARRHRRAQAKVSADKRQTSEKKARRRAPDPEG